MLREAENALRGCICLVWGGVPCHAYSQGSEGRGWGQSFPVNFPLGCWLCHEAMMLPGLLAGAAQPSAELEGPFPSSLEAYCISFLLSGPSTPLQRTWSQLLKYQTMPALIQACQAPTYYWELPAEGQGGLGAATEICEASVLSLTASRSESFSVVHLILFCMSWS